MLAVESTITSNSSCRESILVTQRELQVLKKLSEGLTVKEIASSLYVSSHTIDSHKKNLLLKFNARNSVDLIVKSIKLNFVQV